MAGSMLRVSLLILALAAPATIAAQEALMFNPPPDWERGNVEQVKDQLLMEFVKKGEKVDSWTELLTVQQFRRSRGSPSPRQFYDQLKATRQARCPGLSQWQIVDEGRETVLYEWNTTGVCEGQPAQWELARLIFGRNTGYRVAYTTRAQLTEETRATWTEWLRGLSMGR